MGERSPINDTDARGTFTGIRMDTKRSDLVQAVLEGVAFAIRDSFEVACNSGIEINYSSLCGGGAKSPLWQKIFCNVLNIKIGIPQTEEGPGYGGAILAMVGCGEYATVSEATGKLIKTKDVTYPDDKLVEKYNERYCAFKKLYPALKDVYKEI